MRAARFIPLLALLAACASPSIVPATPSTWLVTGDGQSGVPGYRLPNKVTVQVNDLDGRPIIGDTIDFTVSDDLAALEPSPIAVTDSTGAASVYWRLGKTLGTQTLSARSRIPGVETATVTATARSNYMQSIDGSDLGLCGVDTPGRLACWLPPRLGVADATTRFVPATSSARFTQVATLTGGKTPQGCAITDTGRVWCFTINPQGNLVGLSELADTYPAFTQLVSGGWQGSNYCALTALGEAWCWGDNAGGVLGDGTTLPHASPAPVATAVRFTQIDMTYGTACGITTSGVAWCWGRNSSLQAGGPQGVNAITVPVAVATPLRFTKVRATGRSSVSCGFVAAGGMYCWGAVQNDLLFTVPGASPTATPVAIATNPAGIDIFDNANTTIMFDRGAGLQWGGDVYGYVVGDRGAIPFPRKSALPPGMLQNIAMAHGAGFFCGTAALGGATLCPSLAGMFFKGSFLSGILTGSPAVVGVPFP